MDKIAELQKIFDESKRIVFFTGAGVSTESGIPDFRSQDGLYHQKYKYNPETIISHSFFWQDTAEFYRFYRDRMIYPDAKPNPAHLAMAEYERIGKSAGVVTQNIDGLHSLAGSKTVYELHGTIHRNFCTKCKKEYPLEAIMNSTGVPHCSCGGIIKPDVVLYEEGLDNWTINGAINAIQSADCMVITGTSLVVYPASGLVNYFRGNKLVIINKTPTVQDRNADLCIGQPVGDVFSKIIVR